MKKIVLSIIAVTMIFALAVAAAQPVFADGTSPVAENLELTTYRNTSVGGRLAAYDPDGAVAGYEITTKPVKGELRISDGGLFVYTPNENKRGRDYFGYKAFDDAGNYSQEATVIIKIEKQKSGVAYSDLGGSACEYAAVALSERGIFTGEKLCGKYCFDPEREVSRWEFLAMCMELSGEPILTGVMSTGFADDGDIQSWMKGYVATAAMCGAEINASPDGARSFSPAASVTVADAALMLSSLLNVTPASYLASDAPSDAVQACMDLTACGVLDSAAAAQEPLSRGAAAQMLISALDMLNSRK